MKKNILGLFIIIMGTQLAFSQSTPQEQEVIKLSKDKWQWMADKNVDALTPLFHEKSVFVHMGGTWGKEQELKTIKTGGIWYKKAEVYSVTVNNLSSIIQIWFKRSYSCTACLMLGFLSKNE